MMFCFRRASSPVARADRFDTGCRRNGPVNVGLAVAGFPSIVKIGALGLCEIHQNPATASLGNSMVHEFGRATR